MTDTFYDDSCLEFVPSQFDVRIPKGYETNKKGLPCRGRLTVKRETAIKAGVMSSSQIYTPIYMFSEMAQARYADYYGREIHLRDFEDVEWFEIKTH